MLLDEARSFISRGLRETEVSVEGDDWREWLTRYFAAYCTHPFADFHEEFWEWVWALKRGERPKPFIAVWGRGLTKSTSAEMACVAVGARATRKYVLYVSSTQDQADDHVANIADMLGSAGIARDFPSLAERRLNKYGSSQGWKRNRLRTASGFTVDAIGLDKAARGRKLEEDRPDLIIFDDVDDEADSEHVVGKKIRALTRKILPMGSEDLAILGAQNLIHPGSIFAKIVRGDAGFLNDRIVSGPVPAIRDFDHEEDERGRVVRITGEPSWLGLPLWRCHEIINDEGLESFLIERQHRMDLISGAIFEREWWERPGSRYDPDSGAIKNRVRRRYVFIDTAFKDKDSASYTAFVVLEVLEDYSVIVREVFRRRLTFPGLEGAIKAAAARWNADGLLKGVVIEDRASGISVLQTLRLQAEPWLRALLGAFDPGKRSKDERARQAASWCEFAGVVLLPEPKASVPWLFGFCEEELFEENPEYLDRRDAFAMGIIYLERFLARRKAALMNDQRTLA